MFANLVKEIGANKMTFRTVSAAIGMPESTFRYKIDNGNFTVVEAFTIKNRVLPKYSLEYLFENTEPQE